MSNSDLAWSADLYSEVRRELIRPLSLAVPGAGRSPATFAAVPLASGRVHLALGSRTLVSVDPVALAAVGGWDVPATAYAERDGPFNAIRVLAQVEANWRSQLGRTAAAPVQPRPRRRRPPG